MKFDSCVTEKRICTGAAHRASFASPKVTLERSPRNVHVRLRCAYFSLWLELWFWTNEYFKNHYNYFNTSMGRGHDLSWRLLWSSASFHKNVEALNAPAVGSSGCIWKCGGGMQGWSRAEGPGLGCVCVVYCVPMNEPFGFGVAVHVQITGGEGCGWVCQAAPVNWAFLTCGKVLVGWKLVSCWLPKRADMLGVNAYFSL